MNKRIMMVFSALILTASLISCGSDNTDSASKSSSIESSRSWITETSDSDETSSEAVSSEINFSSAGNKSQNTRVSSRQQTSSTPVPTPSANTPSAREIVKVSFPEGFTVLQIAKRLEQKGICTKKDFIAAVNTYDFNQHSYKDVLSSITSTPKRWYKLEGYLYAATYEFYKDMPASDVAGTMIRSAYNNFYGKYSYENWSLDQIITLASVIEKECSSRPSEMAKVSGTFHNRLKKGMGLKSDATIFYIEQNVGPELFSPAEHKKNGENNVYAPYNTYKTTKLPAGPICSPSKRAVNAAANPDTAHPYLYFFTDSKGDFYFSETYEQHKAQMKERGVTEHQDNT